MVIDPVRFPWVEAGGAPTTAERDAAILSTSLLWAQQLATERRGEASTRQEAATAQALANAGLSLDVARSPIQFFDDMARGTYSKERNIAKAKCDVPARLHDGRLLAIECKVSNGPKNSWKRVNREVGGKATDWREQFGTHMLTAVVLAGVLT
ncbi:XamI family restriction endonuclease [Georgenia sp. SUBG003]|uniref:XamI family restriction endonuclease n=1 Tax=Georgenia sp. SUBG003 TaxID=1497974 RepID=UPI003AB73C97